ncbi:MAG: hypothetical protein DRP81_05070 [Candidatus Omnitrophota bacterium]|nr:MAG: hypothetical protein DRP81_05070 [Candidatus Omnitrophota bacterium]
MSRSIYTYLCKKCKGKSDFLVGVNEERTLLVCPHCRSSKVEKIFSPFRVSTPSDSRKGAPISSNKSSSCGGGSCSTCN